MHQKGEGNNPPCQRTLSETALLLRRSMSCTSGASAAGTSCAARLGGASSWERYCSSTAEWGQGGAKVGVLRVGRRGWPHNAALNGAPHKQRAAAGGYTPTSTLTSTHIPTLSLTDTSVRMHRDAPSQPLTLISLASCIRAHQQQRQCSR